MINKNKVLAIVPARGGSKGLPGKNIIDVDGEPLLFYTFEQAKKSKYIDRIIILNFCYNDSNFCSTYI